MELEIKDYVINVVANDYENLALIVDEVSAWASKEQVAVTRVAILHALHALIGEGLVDSYRFSQSSGQYEPADLASSNLDELWFYVSKRGKARLSAPP
jgi:hypothetical protein